MRNCWLTKRPIKVGSVVKVIGNSEYAGLEGCVACYEPGIDKFFVVFTSISATKLGLPPHGYFSKRHLQAVN